MPHALTQGLTRACSAGEQFSALKALCADIKGTIRYQTRESPGGTNRGANLCPQQWELSRFSVAVNRGGSRLWPARPVRFGLFAQPSI